MKLFNSCKTDNNRINMFNMKASYKRLVKQKKCSFDGNKVREIERLSHAKLREFWKLFSKRKKNASNIPLNDLFECFSNMHNGLLNTQDRESEDFRQNNDLDLVNYTFEELDKAITLEEVE